MSTPDGGSDTTEYSFDDTANYNYDPSPSYGGGGDFGGGGGFDAGGDVSWGEPIRIGSGNVFERVVDYRTFGQNRLAMVRYYNSLSGGATLAGTLGQHWRTSFDRYLHVGSSFSTTVERADGQQLVFTSASGTWNSDSDIGLKLTQSGSSWTLTDQRDTMETYTAVSATEARLTSITTRNGYSHRLSYNSANQLISVTDSYGRSLDFSYANGLLHSVATPDGLTITYTYDSSSGPSGVLDRLVSATFSTVPTTTLSYVYENPALPFAVTGIIDENGSRYVAWTYDKSGRALSSQHAGGAGLTTVAYNDVDGSRTVTNSLGQQMIYEFTTLQGVPKVTEIDRVATPTVPAGVRKVTYDASGYLASQTDWNGTLTTYVNDAQGRPTAITKASGTLLARTTTLTYHPTYHLPLSVATDGLSTTFKYDSTVNLLTETSTDTTTTTSPYSTKGLARTITFTWTNGLLASKQKPRTDVSEITKYTYDSSGALTSITNPLSQTMQITQHTPGGWPQTIVDANGVQTDLTYDARLRPVTRTIGTASGKLTTKYSYDLASNLLTITGPDGSVATNSYDLAHRLISITDIFNQSISYTLDAHGNRTALTISDTGGTVQFARTAAFDSLSRMVQDTAGAGQVTNLAYDPNGNRLNVTDPLGHVTQLSFDVLNRPTQMTNEAKGRVVATFDAHNRPTSITDPNGTTTSFTYDGFGDLIQEISPARGTTVYRYDLDGNLVQRVDARGAIANFVYDALGRPLTKTYPGDPTLNVSYAYDEPSGAFGVGRLTTVTDAVGALSRTYDERENVVGETRRFGAGPLAATTNYTYDAASRVASITYPSGALVAYGRDTMGRVTSISATPRGAAQPVVVASNITYQPFGPMNSLTYGNGITENRTFDLDYRLTSLADNGNTAVQNLTYGYDPANNILSISDAVTPTNSQQLGVDVLDRLTSAAGVYGSLSYTYDANGNRLMENPPSTALDGLGQVTSFTYNQAGRLASASSGDAVLTQYAYDALGHRLVKNGSITGTTLYHYDLGGRLLTESDGTGYSQADYIYLGGVPLADLAPGGGLYFLHNDRLGTPQVATDTNQALAWVGSYAPFGALNPGTGQNVLLAQDLRLPGQESDLETGLYHNGFRDYAPGLGRYVQSDPIGLLGAVNSYAYASASPSKFVDPSGTISSEFIVEQTVGFGGEHLINDNTDLPPYSASYIVGGSLAVVVGGVASEGTIFANPNAVAALFNEGGLINVAQDIFLNQVFSTLGPMYQALIQGVANYANGGSGRVCPLSQ